MKEAYFIRNNIEAWQHVETLIDQLSEQSVDDVAAAYLRITTDLSFAQTHYPASAVTPYLNSMAAVLHDALYRNRREPRSRVFTFWTREVPQTMWAERRMLLLSLAIFLVSVAIGIVSQLGDDSFCRTILGDYYVDMTLDNIANGKPMDVYASQGELNMMFGITLNNILVAFRTFVSGVLTSFMTGLMLFYNGVMMGCFVTFFGQQDLLGVSLLTIMQHGTLELTAIVVAGAGGLVLGRGLLMPGSYSRLRALRMCALRGLKIVVGTVPIFIVAGFIESFVTRHTDWPFGLRLATVLLSAAFLVFYYVVLPYLIHKKQQRNENHTASALPTL